MTTTIPARVAHLLAHRRFRALLLLLVVVASPFVVHGIAYLSHSNAYAGFCGPHAPDIPRHACTREVYLSEFGAGFGGIALLVVEVFTAFATGIVALFAWWGLEYLLRTRQKARSSMPETD